MINTDVIITIVNNALHYLPIIPAVFFCLIPLWKNLKVYGVVVSVFSVILVTGFSLILGTVQAQFIRIPNPGAIIILLYILAFFVLNAMVNVSIPKVFYIFMYCTALMFAFVQFTDILDNIFPYKEVTLFHTFTLSQGMCAQYLFSILSVVLMYFARNKMSWFFNQEHGGWLWALIWIIPAAISICEVHMYHSKSNIMVNAYSWKTSLLFLCCMLIILFANQFLLRNALQTIVSRNALEQRSSIMKLEAEQYSALRDILDKDRRMRHDFRQTVYTMYELSSEGKYEELQQYITTLADNLPQSASIYNYCEHHAANALISYYANYCRELNIETDFRCVIPADISIDQIDLCQVIGNLLANATKACETIPEEMRYIHLSIDPDQSGQLFIICTNTFDGVATKSGKLYSSRKISHVGIGLSSIQYTAEKYHGVCRFYHQRNEFHAEIMMQMLTPPGKSDKIVK